MGFDECRKEALRCGSFSKSIIFASPRTLYSLPCGYGIICDGREENVMAIYEPLELAGKCQIAGKDVNLDNLPGGYEVKENLGIAAPEKISGSVVYRTDKGTLFETRAIKTAGGEYLLMFPTNTVENPEGNCHYGRTSEKVNDLVAFRSKNRGKTWDGPTRPIDIDYNLHGFVPFVPERSDVNPGKRIYCFGTQPIRHLYTRENGLHENVPIGYRYSDDNGQHWSEVRLIRPENDPGFTGMSVMRMCETQKGTWLIGAHEGDWSYQPLMTRQYILRSENQGKNWELLPGRRHWGWHARGYNRMDEGRPISLADGRVLLMLRTPEGHLWQSWSEDDGQSWTDPAPSSLVHPDAPPMLFHLSDGKTLTAFHHNRYHDKNYSGLSGAKEDIMKDRSEIWVSFSKSGGERWSEPRFVFSTAVVPRYESAWYNYQCSYIDMFLDGTMVNLFVPHLWHQVLHLQIEENDLLGLSTAAKIQD